MKNLNIKINGSLPKDSLISIDDKVVKFKRDKHNKLFYNYQTESSKVTINIKKYSEMHIKHWFFWQMFMFFITLFGIFDSKLEKKVLTINCKFNVFINQDESVVIKCNKFIDEGEAIQIETNANVFVEKNAYKVDKEAKKKFKKLKIAKILSVFGIGIVIALLIILLPII